MGSGLPAPVIVAGANLAVLALALRATPLLALALAVVVLAPLGWMVIERPQRGILLLVALAPLDGLLEIVPHPRPVDGWKEALTIFVLLATFVAPMSARGTPRRPLPKWFLAVVGLLVTGITSGVATGGINAVYGLKIGFFYLLVFWVLWRCPFDARDRDRVVSILMGVGALTAAIGVLQQLVGYQQLHALGYEYNTTIRFSGGFLRSFSTFVDPFGFGFFLMVVVLVCLPVALSDPHRPRNQLFLLAMPLFGLALASTFVRGAWLGVAVGVAYLASRRHRVLLLGIPLCLVLLPLVPHDVASEALSAQSTRARAAGWSDNLDQLATHPFGLGVGTAGSAAQTIEQLRSDTTDLGALTLKSYQPDNYYFLTVYELGALGLWFVILLLLAAFASMRDAMRTLAGSDAALASGASAMVLAAAVVSIIATYFQIFPMDVLWWVLLAAVGGAVHEHEASVAAGLT